MLIIKKKHNFGISQFIILPYMASAMSQYYVTFNCMCVTSLKCKGSEIHMTKDICEMSCFSEDRCQSNFNSIKSRQRRFIY